MEKVYSKDPMERGLYNQLFGLDEETFRDGVEQMLKNYNKLLKEVDGVKYLPKGTILYHGSLVYPFYADSQAVQSITYLGLDMDISMWYIYELLMLQTFCSGKRLKDKITGSESFKRNGFLYAFKLVKDLPITHVIDKLHLAPKELRRCKKNTCLHPQVCYRGPEFNYMVGSRLHTELTLHYNSYKDYLKIIRVYIVDGLALHKHHGDLAYNVRTAILQEYAAGTDYELPISYQAYSDMFLGELYYCDNNCGFSGNYQDVLEHEKTCATKESEKKHRRSKKKKKRKIRKKKKKPTAKRTRQPSLNEHQPRNKSNT